MIEQTTYDRLRNKQAHCRGFEFSLIETYFKADGNNKRILEEAFKGTAFDLT